MTALASPNLHTLPESVLRKLSEDQKTVGEALKWPINVERMGAAIPVARRIFETRQRLQGDGWWETIGARINLNDLIRFSAMPERSRQALWEKSLLGVEIAADLNAKKYPAALSHPR